MYYSFKRLSGILGMILRDCRFYPILHFSQLGIIIKERSSIIQCHHFISLRGNSGDWTLSLEYLEFLIDITGNLGHPRQHL
jgi:hypothetical protein